ncbi:hypothetical protein KKD52_06935 [Myxococcota bacterium]|nr:hypothetical protein [Myxococcota bacterium]MBU1410870.1 hypothetical protein [Myxococcota bacterium]MBU1510080.1 hypothetical protein [Myxococcota bacterium]
MKSFFLLLFCLIPLCFACDDVQEKPLPRLEDPLHTGRIDFSGMGRIYYEITGPDFETPNVAVGDTLVVFGDARVDGDVVLPERNWMAAYASDATPLITITPAWTGPEGTPPGGTYDLRGKLVDSAGVELELFSAQGELEQVEESEESDAMRFELLLDGDDTIEGQLYAPITITAARLPHDTAKVYTLVIEHVYTTGEMIYRHTTHTEFAQVWRAPLPNTILYQQIIRWGSQWIDATVEDLGEPTENQLADVLLLSLPKLVPLGYRYGSLVRPVPYTNKAEVFLDYKQSACGEFYGFFMDLVETQGIDANYLIFMFPNPSPDWYSMYQTIDIPALGRESKVWRYGDHGLVEVNGRVYDPTYVLIKENADEYEDYLFANFCYGDEGKCGRGNTWCLIPDGPQGICADNEPGYDPELGFMRYRGETY